MSSSSMPSAKRRRVDAANETLKKPFRSPMVKRPQPQAGPELTASLPAAPALVSGRESTGGYRQSTPSKLQPHPLSKPGALPNATSTPSRPGPRQKTGKILGQKPAPRTEGITDKDTDLLDQLRWRRKEAELKTRAAEKEMELVRQAARIESGKETTNEELAALVRSWKGACRVAAEELFELIRGRVDSMGGAAAWRESRQQGGGWGDEETAEERKKRREAGGEEGDEREELEGLEEVGEGEDGDGLELSEERDFTMHMMLKSLNIDPKIVGYDPAEDKWRDWG